MPTRRLSSGVGVRLHPPLGPSGEQKSGSCLGIGNFFESAIRYAVARSLSGHTSNVKSLDFHPFGEFIASGSQDTNIRVWTRVLEAAFPFQHIDCRSGM